MMTAAAAESGGSGAVDVAVVGGGAAGLTAAIFAARRGAKVVVFETRPQPGAKIRVSGGGRCNVLPSVVDLSDFHTGGSTKAMRNVLFSWPLADVRRFFEDELGVPLVREEATGKLFPKSQRAKDIVLALLAECGRSGAEIRGGARVEEVLRASDAGGDSEPAFEIATSTGGIETRLLARRVILATGGKSLPRTGSDGHGFEIARALGHAIRPTFPVLVPLSVEDIDWTSLPGIALRVELTASRDGREIARREGDFLFTHRGFSGPVVLDMSRWLAAKDQEPETKGTLEGAGRPPVELRARWLGRAAPDWRELLASGGKRSVATLASDALPRRLALLLIERAGIPADRRACDLRRDERERLLEMLERAPLPVTGDEGYATAEATGGGVCLEDLHLKTLESRIVPGLHFCGEILDVDGRIGGFNFLWAWVTGRKAGEGAASPFSRSHSPRQP